MNCFSIKTGRAKFAGIVNALVLACMSTTANSAPLEQTTLVPGSGEHVVHSPYYDYALYIPQSYNDDPTQKFPLILAMAGVGGNVLNLQHTELLPLSAPGNQKTLEGFHRQFIGRNLNEQNYPAIVVSPNCNRTGRQGTCWFNAERTNNLVSSVMQALKVDEERVFLTGLSGGAQTAMLASMNEAPKRYAGILPIAFKPLSKKTLQGKLCKYSTLHIWAWGGLHDKPHNPNTWGRGFQRAVKTDCGDDSLDNFMLSVVPDGGHNPRTWNTAYADPAVHQWFLTKTRMQTAGVPSVSTQDDFSVNELAESFTLTADYSDPDGQVTGVTWSQVSGPEVVIDTPSAAETQVLQIQPGEYVFNVTVVDNDGQEASDTIEVMVISAQDNLPPTIQVATYHRVFLPENSLTVEAQVSDSDGIARVAWEQLSGASVFMSGATTNTVTLDQLQEGNYVFQVFAEDVYGVSQHTNVEVVVETMSNNQPVNVALGKPTSASAVQSNGAGTFHASFATDGNTAVRAPLWAPGNVTGERYVEVNLMDDYTIEAISVHSGFNNRNPIKKFSLQGYINGQWTVIPGTQFAGNNVNDLAFSIAPVEAVSKIRFYCEDPRLDNCRLRELAVFANP